MPDALLAALIAKLPPSGATWPAEKRTAWLELMWKAFDVVYEAGNAGTIDLPAFLMPRTAPVAAVTVRPPPPGTTLGPVEYIVDVNGNAKRLPDGMPISVNDVPRTETLWDERPESDRGLDTITWADGQWPADALPQLNIAYR